MSCTPRCMRWACPFACIPGCTLECMPIKIGGARPLKVSLSISSTCCTGSKVIIGSYRTQVKCGGRCMQLQALKEETHAWRTRRLRRTPHMFSVRSLMWWSLLSYKRGDPGQKRDGFFSPKNWLQSWCISSALVPSDSHSTKRYTNKQDVGLLSSGRPEPG